MRRVLFALLLAPMGGCVMGAAHVYQQDTRGGILSLQGSEEDAVQDAHAKMTAHCGPGSYQVVKRETVVVGHEQYTDTSSGYVETGERQRQESTVAEGQQDTEYGYEEGTSSDTVNEPTWTGDETRSDTVTSGGGYESTAGSTATSTIEDEQEVRQGQVTSNSVSGTREVRESRLHYICSSPASVPVAPSTAQ